MAELQVQRVNKAGVADIDAGLVAASAGGDSVGSSSNLMLVFKNVNAASRTITIAAPVATKDCGNLGELTVDPITLTVAQDNVALLAVPAGYADQQLFSWTYDDETDVTVGVFVANP